MIKKIDEFLNKLPEWGIIFIAVLFFVLSTILNYYSNFEMAFSVLYIVPVFMVAWYIGPKSAVIISLLSAITWNINEIYSGKVFAHYVIPYFNTLIRFNVFAIISLFIIEIRGKLNQTLYLADTDYLTGLANSRNLHENIKIEAEKNKQYKRPFTLIYMDLDNFKEVNDTKGHDIGDKLLQNVAEIMKSNVRHTDVAARMGGDEFAILLPETEYNGAETVLAKFHSSFLQSMNLNEWPVTFSIGAITFQNALHDSRIMIKAVDDLMYNVKTNGKNRILHEQW